MLGWLFGGSAECPVDPRTREWLDSRWRWVCDQLAAFPTAAAEVPLPTPKFFPERYDATDFDTIQTLFGRVCGYMRLDPNTFTLRLFDDGHPPPNDFWLGGLRREGRANGYYERSADGCTIWLNMGILESPLRLVATMAHELAHEHLLGRGRVTDDTPDHEPLTDLVTVYLGLGVITANGVIQEANWTDGRMSGWSISRNGYLDMPAYGYALALFARSRGEVKPSWRKELRPDVRAAFDRGLQFLNSPVASDAANPR